jgi:Trehalose utilisation
MRLTRREFLATFAVATVAVPVVAADKPKPLVLIAGTPSHGAGAHEFNAGVQLLAKCLKDVRGLDVRVVLSGLMDKGVGLMCAHYGVEVPKEKGGKEFQDWIGGYYESGWSVNPIWRPELQKFPRHPIANGLKPFSTEDEWYFNMCFRPDMKGVTPILTATPTDKTRDGPYVYPKGPYKHIKEAKGRSEHMMWAVERNNGRGVGFTGGHFHTNWQNDNFRKAVLNALVLDLQSGCSREWR